MKKIFIWVFVFSAILSLVICKNNSDDSVIEPELSSECSILSFVIDTWSVRGGVDYTNNTVILYFPQSANLTSMTPSISVSEGAIISPASGVAQDFSNSVNYTVTAEDGSTNTYTVTAKRESPWIDVTLVGNAGFLINTLSKRILIDAIHVGTLNSPSGELFDRIRFAEAPFDNIDMIFVTHNHADHFNGAHVATYLERHPNVVLVCPEDVANDVALHATDSSAIQNRVITVTPDTWTENTLEEINFRTLYLSHGVGAPHNNGYLINLEGYSFIHTGDTMDDIDHFALYPWLIEENVDLGFFDRYFIINNDGDGERILREAIQTDHIILMHIYANEIQILDQLWSDLIIEYPNLTFFRNPLETQRFNH